jgi:hypothetical protein
MILRNETEILGIIWFLLSIKRPQMTYMDDEY